MALIYFSLYNRTMILEEILQDMIAYNKSDIARINHAIKVYTYTCLIMANENVVDKVAFVGKVTAILHDIGIHVCEKKYKKVSGYLQEIEGPPVALKILKRYNLPKETLERILYLISKHHSYSEVNGMDFQVLIEADFIVNAQEENYSDKQKKIIMQKYFKTKSGATFLYN